VAREVENKTKSHALRVATAGSKFHRDRRQRLVPESSQLTQNPADVTTLAGRSLGLHPVLYPSDVSERAYPYLLHFNSRWYKVAGDCFSNNIRSVSNPHFEVHSWNIVYQGYFNASL